MEFMTIHQQPNMLQAFVAGDYARQMEALPEDTVRQHLVTHLATVTGQVVPEPVFFRRLASFLLRVSHSKMQMNICHKNLINIP